MKSRIILESYQSGKSLPSNADEPVIVYHEYKIEPGVLWKSIVLGQPSFVKSAALVAILHVDKVTPLPDGVLAVDVTPMVNDELGPEIVTLLVSEPARLLVNPLDWESACRAA